MCELETLPGCERNTSMSTLPALQTLRDTVWACKGTERLTRANRSPAPKTSLAIVFLPNSDSNSDPGFGQYIPSLPSLQRRRHLRCEIGIPPAEVTCSAIRWRVGPVLRRIRTVLCECGSGQNRLIEGYRR